MTSLLNESQQLAKIGAWELDLRTQLTTWTDEVYSIHEVEKGFDHNVENGIDFYHPEDRHLISESIGQSIENQEEFDLIARFITAKNTLIWVRVTGKTLHRKWRSSEISGAYP